MTIYMVLMWAVYVKSAPGPKADSKARSCTSGLDDQALARLPQAVPHSIFQ